jgi:NADH-quinone oxidoreductase subunit C
MADDQALIELSEYIAEKQEQAVLRTEVAKGELCVHAQAAHIVKLLSFLRDDPQCLFKVLIDICGVDYPERAQRFEVVYQLLSLHHNQRMRVKIDADDEFPVPSVTSVYNAANWFERETWDMYGVMFSDHPDLRRLLTDYGFEGHPLRKDFPLTGFVEVKYDEEQKRVLYQPVNLAQEFRTFDFMSPWEGAEYILPGDEKAGGQE